MEEATEAAAAEGWIMDGLGGTMDASFDDKDLGYQWQLRRAQVAVRNAAEDIEKVEAYDRAKQQSEQALRNALAVDGLELLHGSDCRCAECCEKRKNISIP